MILLRQARRKFKGTPRRKSKKSYLEKYLNKRNPKFSPSCMLKQWNTCGRKIFVI
jgi:hypothetical protein